MTGQVNHSTIPTLHCARVVKNTSDQSLLANFYLLDIADFGVRLVSIGMCLDTQRRFSNRVRGQGIDVIRWAVLFNQGLVVAEIERPHRAGIHATGVFALVYVIGAKIAFTHHTFLRIELRCAIRANPGTIFTTDTKALINLNDAVLTFPECMRRTVFDTDRIFAVVAGHGQVVGKYVLAPRGLLLFPATAGHLINPSPDLARAQIILVLTGHLAGFAA